MRNTIAAVLLIISTMPAFSHDEYIGLRDPITGGSCCTTARGDGYGDCEVLELAPGVLTPVPEGYIINLTKEQAEKINPRSVRAVRVFVPRERIQPALFNEYRLCMGPTGTLYCFFEPGGM
jgi:hypothetical protein